MLLYDPNKTVLDVHPFNIDKELEAVDSRSKRTFITQPEFNSYDISCEQISILSYKNKAKLPNRFLSKLLKLEANSGFNDSTFRRLLRKYPFSPVFTQTTSKESYHEDRKFIVASKRLNLQFILNPSSKIVMNSYLVIYLFSLKNLLEIEQSSSRSIKLRPTELKQKFVVKIQKIGNFTFHAGAKRICAPKGATPDGAGQPLCQFYDART